jgi:ankyrin repeat protein
MTTFRLLCAVLFVTLLASWIISQDKAVSFWVGQSRGNDKTLVNAIETGDRAWAERILKRDPSLLKMRDRYQRSPVFLAVSATKNRAEMVSWLLALGAEVDATQQNGFTPLYWAALMGDATIVDILLRHDADVNIRSKNGQSAL